LDGLAESTELLVSELVTNAVKAVAGQGNQAAVRLRLSSDNARFLVEVWDADPRPPVPKDLGADGIPDVQEEGGRGLFLVAALSARWNWYLTQEPTGKVVWCLRPIGGNSLQSTDRLWSDPCRGERRVRSWYDRLKL